MTFLKRNLRLVITAAIISAALAASALFYLKTSSSVLASGIRAAAGDFLSSIRLPAAPDPLSGIKALSDVSSGGNRRVITTGDYVRLFDGAAGFMADFPSGTEFDLSLGPKLAVAKSADFKAVISKEWSAGADVSEYIDYYFNRFALSEDFRQNNGVTLISEERGENLELLTLRIDNYGGFDTYTYTIFKTGTRYFYRIMIKYNSGKDMTAAIGRICESFRFFAGSGNSKRVSDYYPVLPENWSTETRALYDKISGADRLLWGIFTEDVKETGISTEIPRIEENAGMKFDIILAYAHLGEKFPSNFMERCQNEGRIVELTYQLTANNNEDLYAASPLLEMHRGAEYQEIRDFARAAKDFGHTFLFRLNNEMNSDWTSYGGVNNLSDPDIFIENWRKIYDIFQEEGVDNAIWIFNPNDRDCPPNAWNSGLEYYPGNEYVQLIGITGYNNGSYYSDVTGESWREFKDIYDKIVSDMGGTFDRFPWIITEFASSSVGGDKARWIEKMFAALPDYPNIKAAVWFSYADYDFRPEYAGRPARPYWLDETPETLDAFKRGAGGG